MPQQLAWLFIHDVNPDVLRLGMLAAKVNRMTAQQAIRPKRRRRNAVRVQFPHCAFEALKVRRLGQNGKIHIAAKFGRAVQDAGLTAHQQGLNMVSGHRRKDFVNPVRDQGNLQWKGNAPKVRRFGSSVPAGSSDTNRPTPPR